VDHTSEVSVAVRRSPQETLSVALSKLTGPLSLSKGIERVVIKTSIYDPDLPGNTSLVMVRYLSRLMGSTAQVTVVESDNPLRSAESAFSRSGYTALEKEGVKLVNLSSSPTVDVRMPGHMFHDRPMPAILSRGLFLVNVATLKLDPDSRTIGAGIKNLFGLLPEKDKSTYHERLDDCLLDLLAVFRPDLTVMDLTEVAIGPRDRALIRKVGGAVVGTDPVAVDAYCASLLGIDPSTIPYLRRAHELGLGEIILDRIHVRGTEHQKRLIAELTSAE
jgi:uncharacterized protein (DUF362 family)